MYSFVINIVSSVISGVLLFLSFPKFGTPIFAWVCLVPLFCVTYLQNKIKSVIFYSTICGVVGYSGIFYWIVPTFKVAGENVVFGIIATFLLSLYFTVFLCIFCLYIWLIKQKNVWFVVSSASLWVILEYLITYLFTGFPWTILGVTQYSNIKLIQIADVFGVYGVSFILIFSNLVLSIFLKDMFNRKICKNTIVNIFLLVLLMFITLSYGSLKLKLQNGTQKKSLVVVLLQGNIDQYKKWDKSYVKEIMDKYTKLVKESCTLIENNIEFKDLPVLFVWPESSVPGWLFEEKFLYDWITELVKYTNSKFCSYHLIGTVRMGKYSDEYYNSAVLFTMKDKNVVVEKIYDKIHLVPFGEYVPFRSFLGKFIKTVNDLGEFTKGKNYTVFNISLIPSTEVVNFSTLICYESIFSYLTKKFVLSGAEVLVNITNDAWFLKTSAPYQHFVANIFRAVENRCFVFRCANTGISGIIAPTGEVISKTELFQDTVLIKKINLYHEKTFYTKFGEYLWLVYTFLFFICNLKILFSQ